MTSNRTRRGEGEALALVGIVFGAFLLLGGIGGCMWGYPAYTVYEQEKAGQAELAKAESNRKIVVLEAQAKQEAAKALAAAEITRAEGVAQANKIIGESLKDNESYLRYLWIQGLQEKGNEVIYVPTEANLPILEASRFRAPVEKPKP